VNNSFSRNGEKMALKSLKEKTLFITGASRGIGKAIALKAAKDGANIVIVAKTSRPHPALPGTIYTAAEEIEAVGGRCLPCAVDIRSEEQVERAVSKALSKFGGIDILVNNASALYLLDTLSLPLKRYNLMQEINTRGTFLCSQKCIPHLKKADNPHVLNISPPLNMGKYWFSKHAAYTIAKYGMSMCALGMAEEFRDDGIAFNALWPKYGIATAAVKNNFGAAAMDLTCKPDIMADAAYAILLKNSRECTGNFFVDVDVLRAEGVSDFKQYQINPSLNESQLIPDLFL